MLKKIFFSVCWVFLCYCSIGFAQEWVPPVIISSQTTLNTTDHSIGVDGFGNAFAAWIESNGVTNIVRGSRFDALTQEWTESGPLSLTSAEDLQLAVTLDGKAIAVWRRVNSNYTKVEYATYQNGAWSFGAPIDTTTPDTTDELFPVIGVDNLGNAIATWQVGGSPGDFIRSGIYNFQSNTWGSFQDISPTATTSRGNSALAVNSVGQAVAIWEFIDTVNSTNKLEASQYTGGVWQPVEIVISSGSTTLLEKFPRIAIDASGNAVAVWTQFDSVTNNYTIQSSTRTNSWSTPITISPIGNNNTFPTQGPLASISLAEAGDGVAAWLLSDQSIPVASIQARAYQNGSWSPTTKTLSDPNTEFTFNPSVAIDGAGDGWVLWTAQPQFASTFSIEASKFTRSTSTWGSVQTLSDPSPSALPEVSTSNNFSGNFFAIWVNSPDLTNFNIVADHTLFILSPTGISGKQEINRFPVDSERFNLIHWQPSPSFNVVSYQIYRNGKLIATVPPNILKYKDHNRLKHVKDTYAVAAVSATGIVSEPVTITLP